MIHKKRWGIAVTTLTIATLLITQKLQPAGGATVTTDKHMYHQGETMAITGTGFLSNHSIALTVQRPDHVTETVPNVSTDAAGTFTASYLAPGINGSYRISATDGTNAADTHAADPFIGSVQDYSQCSNDLGTGYTTGDLGCRWINGNLQKNNSTYVEGDATVQRTFLAGMTAGSHTITFQYDTTKGGAHAYDFLTDDKYSETWITDADMCDGASTNLFASCTSVSPSPDTSLSSIPLDPNAGGIDGNAANLNRRHVRIRNGVITGIDAPTIASGSYSGDSDTAITVHFTVDTSTCANVMVDKGVSTCPVLITFGAHISKKSDWNGAATASTIEGSPYHVALNGADGSSIGQKDNQMQASAVGGTLTLIKTVTNDNGGQAQPPDWTLSATGPATISGVTASTAVTSVPVPTGTYTLAESNGPSGYTAGGWSCSINNATTVTGSSVTLTSGDVAVCTINNDDIGAQLKLVKHVVNDNGGTANASAWTLTASGTGGFSGTGLPATGPDASVGPNGVSANVQYTLSESGGPSGYTASAWVCTGGGTFVAPDKITLAAGQSATCTITNDDNAATLIVIKHVINDNGGTKTAADFTMTIGGVTTSGTSSFAGVESPGVSRTLTSVGAFTVTEGAVAGYTQTSAVGCSGTIALGETKTCTITNDDNAATLIVIKHVINDNGGTKAAADFTMTIGGVTTSGTSSFAGAESPGVSRTLTSLGAFTVTEGAVDGYTQTSAVGCSGTIALGETKTCTITNDDNAATLIVIKHVINDNGGAKTAADFTMTIGGVTTSGTSSFAGAESPGVTRTLTSVGAFTVTEGAVAGYTQTSAVGCSGTIALGETKTCTITNDDNAATLVVIKHVINDNGGTKAAADFTMTIGGVTTSGTSSFAGAESPGVTRTLTSVGAFTVTEGAVAGYTQTNAVGCSGTIALGETKTCTITNDDNAATLVVIKHVINDNGGAKTAADFTMTIGGVTTSGTSSFAGTESPGVSRTLTSVGAFTVTEGAVAGYTQTSAVGCSGTIALGETKTCTITNDDNAATLIVIKHVINNNGGAKTAADFTMTIGGVTTSGTSSFAGAESPGVTRTLTSVGAFTVTEGAVAGYTQASAVGCSGTIALGETKTCTITNDDQPAYLKVIKHVINDNGGTKTAADFTMTIGGVTTSGTNPFAGAESPGVTRTLTSVGAFTVTEGAVAGYTQTSAVGCSGTIALGETKTCTITNDDQPAHLTLLKAVINNFNGQATAANFTVSAAGPTPLSGAGSVTGAVNAGNYTLTESSLNGYKFDSLICTGGTQSNNVVTLGVGQSASCTFTNEDLPGTIIIKKVSKPVNTGSFAFTTTGTGYNGFTIPGGGQNSQTLAAGSYSVKESTQLGWILTGIGGAGTGPYDCTVAGSGGSSGVGNLTTQTANIILKNGDTVTCVFENTGQGVTRTQGFWATHTPLANIAWFGGTAFGHTFPGVADTVICGRPVDDLGKVMGSFWSDISKTSTSAKRSSLDQARMQLLQQLIAAELNSSAFGSVPSMSFAAMEGALCSTNAKDISNAQQAAASFNSSGDSGTFTPGTSADSKNARTIANIPFWDIIKP